MKLSHLFTKHNPIDIDLEKATEFVLGEVKETRSSDLYLCKAILSVYDINILLIDFVQFVNTVTRIRRKLNQRGMYLPDYNTLDNRRKLASVYKTMYTPTKTDNHRMARNAVI